MYHFTVPMAPEARRNDTEPTAPAGYCTSAPITLLRILLAREDNTEPPVLLSAVGLVNY
jgi:hypothetical protein